jgi:chloramphenicol-sensitive protein RarD
MIIFIMFTGQIRKFAKTALSWKVVGIYAVASVLIGVNWLLYVWAVNAGHIIETSLGYFINPLLSVLLGVIFLRERLRIGQWIPIIITAGAVLFLAISHGQLPWIALSLAFSFATYGLIKKIAPLGALYGLLLETIILLIPATYFLFSCEQAGNGAFMHSSLTIDLLLIGAGIATTIPLLMFASAAQRIPLSLIGIMQYLSPTLGLLIGYFIYNEPFDNAQIIGYSLVWLSLLIFASESYLNYRKHRSPSAITKP